MDLNEFRIMHSELIEHYQFIEYHLKCICSALQREKPFLGEMESVEKDTSIKLLNQIRHIQKGRKDKILSEEECKRIRDLCNHRNDWVHSCYVNLKRDYKTGVPTNKDVIMQMTKDWIEARDLRELLDIRKRPLQYEKYKLEEAMRNQISGDSIK
jgi:hypothetical protein